MAEIIELGGRKFRAIINSTVEHDFTVMQLLAQAGLDGAAQQEGESYDDFAVRLVSQVISSGHASDLVGTFIIPEDIADPEWIPLTGVATASFVRKLTAPDDKLQIRQLVVTLLAGFCQAGLFSFAVSHDASTEETATPRPAATSSIDSALGVISSGLLQAPIPPGTWHWLAAHLKRLFTRSWTRSEKRRVTTSN
jgi:hypothetical protein